MSPHLSARFTAAVLAAVVLALAACAPPWPQWGALSIEIAEPGAKTLIPGIDMTIAGFDIIGVGPGSLGFSRSTSTPVLTIGGLAFGNWTIAVDGKNASGAVVAHGEGAVKVVTGATQALGIAIAPVTGPGTLSLTVTWTAAAVSMPSIQAQLIPSQGATIDLPFTIVSPGTATSSTTGVMNGYYTLVIRLLDNGQLVMGAVDMVRIVKGETTSGTFTFTNINTGTGSISVSITPQMAEPIPVTMSGQQAQIAAGQAMNLSASVPAGTGNVTFVWYVNGVAKATGAGLVVNGTGLPLGAGVYRIDVTAFTAGGSRGGSTTLSFRVIAAGQVTLEWDRNSESNLAGYRMYVGTASGVYGTPIEAGLNTTCTVTGLISGRTYYFAATAYNTSGVESGKSNVVAYTMP